MHGETVSRSRRATNGIASPPRPTAVRGLFFTTSESRAGLPAMPLGTS
ncbi:hypothetical protein FRUB_06173 [Fimbriiglobus ruber]|uniref:Uncharacterized protein n=1 Tax=Fimbriiglobus ruber TaxID=1908690 RepID=A0A225DC22_9BACT|nr:hypothetical protein FRUB_06173 [Fimbriiglobus ruber]